VSLTLSPALAGSPFADAAALPLRPPETVRSFGTTLVVAPHPDDESLGCGGAIGLLRRYGQHVHVVFVSDGVLSHPHSRRYPAARLRALREDEARGALDVLGVPRARVSFLRLPDRGVPLEDAPGFADAVARLRAMVEKTAPATVLTPWRRDPHPDHRATSALVAAVLEGHGGMRVLEYPIWLWLLAEDGDAPRPSDAMTPWRLDITPLLERKQEAIATHRSQTTDLIDDDPDGFRLEPEMLDHFAHPWEIYLERGEGR